MFDTNVGWWLSLSESVFLGCVCVCVCGCVYKDRLYAHGTGQVLRVCVCVTENITLFAELTSLRG